VYFRTAFRQNIWVSQGIRIFPKSIESTPSAYPPITLFVCGLAAGWRTRRRLTVPPLRRARLLVVHRDGLALSVHLLFHVGPLLDVLMAVADMAIDLVPGFEREGYDGHETQREPLPAQCASVRRVCGSVDAQWTARSRTYQRLTTLAE